MNNAELKICQSCFHENEGNAEYCEKCNAPIGNYSTLDPMQTALSEGRYITDSINKPRNFLVVLGFWIFWGPYVLLYLSFMITLFVEGSYFIAMIIGFLGFIFGGLLFKVTKNFRKKSITSQQMH